MAGGADEAREPHRRVSEPAADVEHAVALMRRVGHERALSMIAKSVGDHVAVLDPDVEQRAVPGLGGLDVVLDYPDRVIHDQ